MGVKCPGAEREIEKPVCFDKLIDYEKKLSNSFYHARVYCGRLNNIQRDYIFKLSWI